MTTSSPSHTHRWSIDRAGLATCTACGGLRQFVNTWDQLQRLKDKRGVLTMAEEIRRLRSYYGWSRGPYNDE